ncbi:hypothetical protein M9H77_04553 [Catharanthus roseus]|uniref:Uncharacterized protein n=1 Tax=Catharanthus roseus TaxID=4058 RepID=A0ACC0CEL0_CATRO|nr:hypothetical protein M9H77_04553 [Catharanthus roseus]
MLTRDFGKFLRRIGKISKPQGRFKNDNRDRKGPNKVNFEGSTMKRKFDISQKGKGIQWRMQGVWSDPDKIYFLENTLSLPVVENLGTEILSVDAHLVHHFIDELSLIVVLPPLNVGSLINQSMEDIDEGIEEGSEGEHNVEGKGSSRSDLEVVGQNENLVIEFYANLIEEFGNIEKLAYGEVYVRGHVIDFSPANIIHYLSCLDYSDIEGTGLKEETDFDEVTKVLTGDAGAV